jgi:hypothetical protein
MFGHAYQVRTVARTEWRLGSRGERKPADMGELGIRDPRGSLTRPNSDTGAKKRKGKRRSKKEKKRKGTESKGEEMRGTVPGGVIRESQRKRRVHSWLPWGAHTGYEPRVWDVITRHHSNFLVTERSALPQRPVGRRDAGQSLNTATADVYGYLKAEEREASAAPWSMGVIANHHRSGMEIRLRQCLCLPWGREGDGKAPPCPRV